jgi:hypothetical protein
MRQTDLIELLVIMGIPEDDIHVTGPDTVACICPLSPWTHQNGREKHPSFGVKDYPDRGPVFNCFACGASGLLYKLALQLGHFRKDATLLDSVYDIQEYCKPKLSNRFASLKVGETKVVDTAEPPPLGSAFTRRLSPLSVKGKKYLAERGVDLAVAEEYGLVEDEERQRLVFPVFSKKKEIVGAVGRTLVDEVPKYYNYPGAELSLTLGGMNKCHQEFRRLILVEGFMDLLKIAPNAWQHKCDVLCIWKARVSETQIRLLQDLDRSISIWLDMDEAGKTGWDKSEPLFAGMYGVSRLEWGWEVKDPGGLSPAQTEELMQRAWG